MAKLRQPGACGKRVLTLTEKVAVNAAVEIRNRTGTSDQRWEAAARDTVEGERARKTSNRRYEQKYNRVKTNPWPCFRFIPPSIVTPPRTGREGEDNPCCRRPHR